VIRYSAKHWSHMGASAVTTKLLKERADNDHA
jgi:hypothetical protein